MLFSYHQIQNLNETEMKIFDYITTHIEDVLKMNVRDLADHTFVAPATIVRFCQKMDCDGYSEFKTKLKIFYQSAVNFDNDSETSTLIDFLQNANSPAFQKQIKDACDLIINKDITFIGIGNSGILGQYGARYFSNVGFYAMAVIDPYYPPKLDHNKDHVLIVLTESGETREVIDQVRLYKQLGSTVIVITNHPQSTIALMADATVIYYVKDIVLPQTYNISTQVPVTYILETMAKELARREKKPMPIVTSTRNDSEMHVELPAEYTKKGKK